MPSSHFDIQAVRAKFPALAQDQVFLDNAGGSQILGAAADAIRDYLVNTNVQLGASYRVGRLSTAAYDDGFSAGARYINAAKDEVVYGSATTQLYRNVSQTLSFDAGDEIVVSALDHEANIASWLELAKRQQLNVKIWTPNGPKSNSPRLTPENLKPLLSSRTRLVALTHCSNILGTIHDVKAIAAAAHEHSPDVLVCVDGVAYAPHRKIDVKDLGVDFYCFSWYKVFGPHVAMLYASRGAQSRMRSLGHYFNPSASLADKIGLAGGSYELIASMPVLVEHLLQEGWEGPVAQEGQLQAQLLKYLTGREDVTVYGETSPDTAVRVPTISFTVENWGSRELVEAIEAKTNLAFRWGSFYSQRLIKDVLSMDPLDGVVRVSMAHYNTREEVDAVINALEQIAVPRGARKSSHL
jgi:cysteine desulfurase family protein (TIGR01976 family)